MPNYQATACHIKHNTLPVDSAAKPESMCNNKPNYDAMEPDTKYKVILVDGAVEPDIICSTPPATGTVEPDGCIHDDDKENE